jgi:hypothetical protein
LAHGLLLIRRGVEGRLKNQCISGRLRRHLLFETTVSAQQLQTRISLLLQEQIIRTYGAEAHCTYSWGDLLSVTFFSKTSQFIPHHANHILINVKNRQCHEYRQHYEFESVIYHFDRSMSIDNVVYIHGLHMFLIATNHTFSTAAFYPFCPTFFMQTRLTVTRIVGAPCVGNRTETDKTVCHSHSANTLQINPVLCSFRKCGQNEKCVGLINARISQGPCILRARIAGPRLIENVFCR